MPSRKKVPYVSSVAAQKTESKGPNAGKKITGHNAVVFFANSDDEALGAATRICKGAYPMSKGWMNHSCVVNELAPMLRKIGAGR